MKNKLAIAGLVAMFALLIWTATQNEIEYRRQSQINKENDQIQNAKVIADVKAGIERSAEIERQKQAKQAEQQKQDDPKNDPAYFEDELSPFKSVAFRSIPGGMALGMPKSRITEIFDKFEFDEADPNLNTKYTKCEEWEEGSGSCMIVPKEGFVPLSVGWTHDRISSIYQGLVNGSYSADKQSLVTLYGQPNDYQCQGDITEWVSKDGKALDVLRLVQGSKVVSIQFLRLSSREYKSPLDCKKP